MTKTACSLAALVGAIAVAGCAVDDPIAPSENIAKVSSAVFTMSDYVDQITIPRFFSDYPGKVSAMCLGYIEGAATHLFCSGPMRQFSSTASLYPPVSTNVHRDTLFRISSVTKVFTASLLAAEVLDGQRSYNNKLVDVVGLTLPSSAVDKRNMTLLDLATHTAGLPRNGSFYANGGMPYATKDQLLSDFQFFTSLEQHSLGTEYYYSNFGFALLGQALSLPGSSFENEIKNRFLSPLGMIDTKTAPPDSELRSRVPEIPGHPIPESYAAGPAHTASGGYYSTLQDMVKFLQWNLRQRSISASTDRVVAEVNTRHTTNCPTSHNDNPGAHPAQCTSKNCIGLGWLLTANWLGSGYTKVDKPGSSNGFQSYIGYLDRHDRGVIVLVAGNGDDLDDANYASILGTEILDVLR